MSAVNPSLGELEARREQLYARLAGVGDFRRGSVSENYRRCGKANCACAVPGHPGHGPRLLWTRTLPRGKTIGRQLAPAEVDKVARELAAYREFAGLSAALVEVNEAICEARPVVPVPEAGGTEPDAGTDGEKRGSSTRSTKRSPPK